MSLIVDITKRYGDFTLRSKFRTEGEMMGFLGSSGSGKSLTLKCIAGIETPDEGKIVLNGVTLFDSEQHINLPPQQRRVGYLFQNYGLFPNMTLEKNILCGLHREKDKNKRKAAAKDMIRRMQLEGLEHHRPHQLSGGQQQRCALARILVNEPDIILLDEPFSALDAFLRDRLEVEMKQILDNYGKDVIMVSHNRDEIYRLCDTVTVIHRGRTEETGKVKAIFAKPATVQAAILTGCKNITEVVRTGEYQVTAPAWNVSFTTSEPVSDDIRAVGLRAHYFNPSAEMNSHEVELIRIVEEPFEFTLEFRYAGADPRAEGIWWRVAKDRKPKDFPKKLGIAPVNVMLLRE